jgi:hypothetical protein
MNDHQRLSTYAANAAKVGYAIPDADFPRMLRKAASAARSRQFC